MKRVGKKMQLFLTQEMKNKRQYNMAHYEAEVLTLHLMTTERKPATKSDSSFLRKIFFGLLALWRKALHNLS